MYHNHNRITNMQKYDLIIQTVIHENKLFKRLFLV